MHCVCGSVLYVSLWGSDSIIVFQPYVPNYTALHLASMDALLKPPFTTFTGEILNSKVCNRKHILPL